MIVTHDDGDHRKGIEELCEIFDVRSAAFPGTFASGDSIGIGADMRLDVLWPPSSDPDGFTENDSSLVLMLRAPYADLLLTGDLEFAGEEALLQTGASVSSDLLKVSHHGSAGATGEEFLGAVRPSFAVISCGKNNSYGHPSDRVIELLEKSDIIYARTDTDGAISLRRICRGVLIFENASKEKRWLIPQRQKNTLSKPSPR